MQYKRAHATETLALASCSCKVSSNVGATLSNLFRKQAKQVRREAPFVQGRSGRYLAGERTESLPLGQPVFACTREAVHAKDCEA